MPTTTKLPPRVLEKWQERLDLLAEIAKVPSALIMRVEPPNITVFLSSESEGNPYKASGMAPLESGLYCEAVMRTCQPLLVTDALQADEWKSNPDIKLGMISYLGLPIRWPNGAIFGTICVLDRKRNSYGDVILRLLHQWRDVLEDDLTVSTALSHLWKAPEEGSRKMAGSDRETLVIRRRFSEMQTELANVNRVATAGELATWISQEVKQPVSACAISAAAGLRWLGAVPPNLAEASLAFERIRKDAMRAADIVDSVRRRLVRPPRLIDRVQINKAIQAVISLTSTEAIKHHISVQLQLAEGLPPVQGDRMQLQQAVQNLMINAIEAMSVVEIGARELTISTGKFGQDSVYVTVRDSGTGVAPEDRARLFDSFYSTKANGMGMGLSICRSIVEAHRGTLSLRTAKPRGAVFQFTIPVASTFERKPCAAIDQG